MHQLDDIYLPDLVFSQAYCMRDPLCESPIVVQENSKTVRKTINTLHFDLLHDHVVPDASVLMMYLR